MEHQRFDSLARLMALSPTRRGILVGIPSILLGGPVSLRPSQWARAQSTGAVPLGSPCIDTSQCAAQTIPELGPPPTCGESGSIGGPGRICCSEEGGLCQGDGECCGDLLCTGSQNWGSFPNCRRAVAVPTTNIGGSCTSPTQCFQTNGGRAVCAPDGFGTPRCCQVDGSACGTDDDCCGAGICGTAPNNSCSGGVTLTGLTVLADTPLLAEANQIAPMIITLPVGSNVSVLTSHSMNNMSQVLGSEGWIGWASTRNVGELTDLLLGQDDLPVMLSVVEDRLRSIEDVAATFPDPAETLTRLRRWRMSQNAYRRFASLDGLTNDGVSGIEVSLYTFGLEEGAIAALDVFAAARSAALGLQTEFATRIGDQSLKIAGPRVDGGFETTIYVRQGYLLARVSAIGVSASSTAIAQDLANTLVSRTIAGR